MSSPTLYKSFAAAGAILAKSFVKFTANRMEVAQASSATDKLAGAADLAALAAGDLVDVALDGLSEVACGAVAIAAGDKITSDANGLAKTAALVAGQTVHVAGVALVPAAPGDVFLYLVDHSVIVG